METAPLATMGVIALAHLLTTLAIRSLLDVEPIRFMTIWNFNTRALIRHLATLALSSSPLVKHFLNKMAELSL